LRLSTGMIHELAPSRDRWVNLFRHFCSSIQRNRLPSVIDLINRIRDFLYVAGRETLISSSRSLKYVKVSSRLSRNRKGTRRDKLPRCFCRFHSNSWRCDSRPRSPSVGRPGGDEFKKRARGTGEVHEHRMRTLRGTRARVAPFLSSRVPHLRAVPQSLTPLFSSLTERCRRFSALDVRYGHGCEIFSQPDFPPVIAGTSA